MVIWGIVGHGELFATNSLQTLCRLSTELSAEMTNKKTMKRLTCYHFAL